MKIGVVGSGLVGSTAAYALVMKGIGRQIILVDVNHKRAQAEAEDILHAVPYAHPLRINPGDYPDLTNCRAVIIAAGVSQKPGESRLNLLRRNAGVFKQVVPRILEHAPNAVLIVATNPVDIMTHVTAWYAREEGIPSAQVIGSGTLLDTARFRALLGNHLGVDSRHVHGYVVGEHGDSEVLTWSLARIGGLRLDDFCHLHQVECGESVMRDIDQKVRKSAETIIEGKGATYYGIGSALAHIVDVVLHDQRAILTVCTPQQMVAGVKDVTVSVPHLVGGSGILATFPLALSDEEQAFLHRSTLVVKEAITSLEEQGC